MAVRLPRLLDGSMKELARLNPATLSLDENLSPLSTAQMVVREGDCAADTGQFVELYTCHGSAGVYRVQQTEQDYGGRLTLMLEHGLTTLGDAIMPGEEEKTGTARELVSELLSFQPVTMWTLGTVAVPDDLTLTWKNDHSNLLESLCTLLDELPGYRLTFDQSVFPWVLGIEALSDADGCECRLSRNLSSLRVEEDRSELCTRLYVNGLADPLDADTMDTYGVITRYMDADTEIGEEELTKQGKAFLEAHKTPAVSVTMDAVDWYEATGEPFDRFTLGRVCRVCLPDYGKVIRQRVIGLSWPDVFGQPDQVTVTLASESTSAVGVMAGLIIDTTITKKRVTSLSSELDNQKELLIAAEDSITLMSTRIDLFAQEVNITVEGLNARIDLMATAEENEELARRVSEAEIAIDGANARIDLKADQTIADSLGERMSAAEIAIDGANAEIALKVSKNGVVSAINMSTEGIKISASKIELDGETIANKLSGGYIDVTSIDANEGDFAALYCDSAYIGSLYVGSDSFEPMTQTIATGAGSITVNATDINYQDWAGNKKEARVVNSITYNAPGTKTIVLLGS
ncbi:MAG: phage tail spike protein [Aristaeellaceae bacterium]